MAKARLHLLGLAAMAVLARASASATVPDSTRQQLERLDGHAILVFANQRSDESHDDALFAYDLAWRKAVESRDAALQFSIQRDKGIFWEDQNRLDSAENLYQKALGTATQNQLRPETRTVLNDLAIVCRKLQRFKDAAAFHLRALDLARAAGDEETVEYTLHGLGFLHEMVGDTAKAIDYYQQSLAVAKRRNHPNGVMVTLGNLAEALAMQGHEEQALARAREGLQLAVIQRDTEQIAQLYFILADVLERFKYPDLAAPNFEKAIHWCSVAHAWGTRAEAWLRLGNLAKTAGNLNRAEYCFLSGIEKEDLLPPGMAADLHLQLGITHAALFPSIDDEKHLLASHRIALQNHLPEAEIAAAKALHDWFFQKKDVPRAMLFLERANFLSDSLRVALREKGNAELAFRYDSEKNKRELEEAQIRQNWIWAGAAMLLGTFLVGGLGFLIRFRRKNTAHLEAKNAEIREANTRLEESNRFLHQFTYAVAHDLKEPLRTISSFIFLLDRRHKNSFTGEGAKYIDFVQTGVKRMNSLIADLLAFSNISSQRPGEEAVNSREILDNVVAKLDLPHTAPAGRISYPPDLPPVRMTPEHLGKLFQNMIHNGLKFNEQAAPEVKIGAMRENGHVLFSVEDNGIGIDPEHGKQIYNLFAQLHKNKPFGGTGIGLTVVKNIVDKYDGSIWFESAGERGTRFWVSLPSAN